MTRVDPFRPPTAIGDRHPDGTWTIAVDLCACGAHVGECDCAAFAAQAATAPVIHATHPAGHRPTRRSHPDTAHRALPAALRDGGTR